MLKITLLLGLHPALPVKTRYRMGCLTLSGNAEGRQCLFHLLRGGQPRSGPDTGRSSETTGAKNVQIVDWEGYREIDREEVARGALKGKPREKLVDIRQMLEIASTGKRGTSS